MPESVKYLASSTYATTFDAAAHPEPKNDTESPNASDIRAPIPHGLSIVLSKMRKNIFTFEVLCFSHFFDILNTAT